MRREILASGKGKATVNGALVPVGTPARPRRRISPPSTASTSPRACSIPTPTSSSWTARRRARRGRPLGRALPALREAEAALERLRRDRREGERRREMLEFQAAEIEKAAPRAGRGGGAPAREGPAGQRRAARRPLRRGLRAALRGRGGGGLAPRSGLPADRGARSHRPRASAPPRGAGVACGPSSRTSPCSSGTTRRGSQVSPGPARRDRVAPRAHRAPQAEVRRDGRGGAGLRRERCRRELEELGIPEERERALEAERERRARLPRSAAARLSARRRRGGRTSRSAWQAELSQLAMEKTRFKVALHARDAADARRTRRLDATRPRARRVPALAQPRRGAAPPGTHRLGRRALPDHAGPQVGGEPRRAGARPWSSTRWTRASAGAWPRWWAASCRRSRAATRCSA